MNLLSTAYFPPIAWFVVAAGGNCRIDHRENYQKQSFRNRTTILHSQGLLNLIIPVVHNETRNILDMEISRKENWVQQHIRSIRSAYQKAPFYNYYWPELEIIVKHDFRYLYQLNLQIILQLCTFCRIETPTSISISEEELYDDCFDFRTWIHPKKDPPFQVDEYIHVFPAGNTSLSKLSILDLLFSKGPETELYLSNQLEFYRKGIEKVQ